MFRRARPARVHLVAAQRCRAGGCRRWIVVVTEVLVVMRAAVRRYRVDGSHTAQR